MQIKTLTYRQFIDSFKDVPRIAVNIIIENETGEILLTKRTYEPFIGWWHFPGSFVLKGEELLDCGKRIAKDELNLNIDPKKLNFMGVFEDISDDPRGHVIDLMYKYKADLPENYQNSQRKFFNKLPPKVGFNHGQTLKRLGYK